MSVTQIFRLLLLRDPFDCGSLGHSYGSLLLALGTIVMGFDVSRWWVTSVYTFFLELCELYWASFERDWSAIQNVSLVY